MHGCYSRNAPSYTLREGLPECSFHYSGWEKSSWEQPFPVIHGGEQRPGLLVKVVPKLTHFDLIITTYCGVYCGVYSQTPQVPSARSPLASTHTVSASGSRRGIDAAPAAPRTHRVRCTRLRAQSGPSQVSDVEDFLRGGCDLRGSLLPLISVY